MAEEVSVEAVSVAADLAAVPEVDLEVSAVAEASVAVALREDGKRIFDRNDKMKISLRRLIFFMN